MKTRKILYRAILTISALLMAIALFSQADSTVVVIPNPFDGGIASALEIYDVLAVALFNIVGYVARTFFKKEAKSPNFLIAIGAGAAVIGGIFYWNGLAGGIELVVQFLFATKLYDFILKPAEQKALKLKENNAN